MLTATADVLLCVSECVWVQFSLHPWLSPHGKNVAAAQCSDQRALGGQRAERKNRGSLKWTSIGRRQETKKEEDKMEGKDGWRRVRGGQSNLLSRANDVLPSPGRERETEPLPLSDVKRVIFFFTVNQGWLG